MNLREKERLLQIMASEIDGLPGDMRDDVIQEGLIAAWRVLTSDLDYDNRDTYAHAAARGRMREVARRQTWTGHTRVHGQPTDPLRQVGKASLDEMLEADSGLAVIAVELIDGLEIAYHHGQIHAAVAALPEAHRDYVYRRFWLGMTDVEIAAETGRAAGTVNATWRRTVRPALAEALAAVA